MKKFILNTSVYLLITLGVVLLFEFAVRSVPNDYSYKCKYLSSNKDRVHVLIVGSSHAYRGVNPAYFSTSAFNAANPSQTIEFDAAISNYAMDHMKNLKWIIVPLSAFSLESDLRKSRENWRVPHYATYWNNLGLQYNWKDHFEILCGDFDEDCKAVFNFYKKGLSNRKCDALGFSPLPFVKDSLEDYMQRTAKSALKRHVLYDPATKSENIARLEKLTQRAVALGVHILYFTPPGYVCYRQPGILAKVDTIAALANNWTKNKGIYYINYLSSDRFLVSDFSDADHLNRSGAEKLSRMLDSFINYSNTPQKTGFKK